MTQIIGVVLVRNEDVHVRRAVSNIAAFCDRILLMDHGSQDQTPKILGELVLEHPHIELHTISDPRESHDLVAGYAGREVWMFAVDGDEIYDPARLAILRPQLLEGAYAEWWVIFGNVLNCDLIDPVLNIAEGYLAPPCRSITKLYNFSLISAWVGDTPERLHGGVITFKAGFDASKRLDLHQQFSWEDATFRCLHACFVIRSSGDLEAANGAAGKGVRARENIMDLRKYSVTIWLRRLYAWITDRPVASAWKQDKYRRGTRVRVDAGPFFP